MKQCMIAMLCLALLLLAAACEPRAERDRPRMSQQELQTRTQLEPYPQAVQASFLRDYPTASVTRVDVFNDVTGRVLYQVNYVQDGRMENVVYSADGQRVVAPAERIVAPPAGVAPPREPLRDPMRQPAPPPAPPAPGQPAPPPHAQPAPR